ncbi:hypothetical protein AQUCO_00100813v1 [Aquilegia coerulea]|uniref:U1-type domain-containing protein n=1 Tax=Aquilegia coerulea TaxID=218851 RepID=A0A2G5FC23_AQUCA|nr:hypothetical protein AQUCO_00100813v1 [Aquilegia coerulea]
MNVGWSSLSPWHCSLCDVTCKSKKSLLAHADERRHRLKARAFHASNQQPKELNELTSHTMEPASDLRKGDLVLIDADEESKELLKSTTSNPRADNGTKPSEKKIRLVEDIIHGDETGDTEGVKTDTIHCKKLIKSILKANDGVMKMKKLQKLAVKSLQEAGRMEDVNVLREAVKAKVTSSSKFVRDKKLVRLVNKSD